jgi:hypothetical protein
MHRGLQLVFLLFLTFSNSDESLGEDSLAIVVPQIKISLVKGSAGGFNLISAKALDSSGTEVPFCTKYCLECAAIQIRFADFILMATPYRVDPSKGQYFIPGRMIKVSRVCEEPHEEPSPIIDESGILWGYVTASEGYRELQIRVRAPTNVFGEAKVYLGITGQNHEIVLGENG